jgi:enamine deaminase RidA (YjgF/YER057c/UK114 family)
MVGEGETLYEQLKSVMVEFDEAINGEFRNTVRLTLLLFKLAENYGTCNVSYGNLLKDICLDVENYHKPCRVAYQPMRMPENCSVAIGGLVYTGDKKLVPITTEEKTLADYTPAIGVEDYLFLSGQVGTIDSGRVIGSPNEQLKAAMNKMSYLLLKASFEPKDYMYIECLYTSGDSVILKHNIGENYPNAKIVLQKVAELPAAAKIEVVCTAKKI